MNIDEFADVLKQAIIEDYQSIIEPFESLIEPIAAIINDYTESIGDIDYFDSDNAVNKVSLLLKHLTLHNKNSKVRKNKYKRIYMRQKIP